MFLPPTSAYLSEYKMTYGELRTKMIAQSQDPLARAAAAQGEAVVAELSLPAGCDLGVSPAGLPSLAALRTPLSSSALVSKQSDEVKEVYPTYASLRSGIRVMDSCTAGQIWCWASCTDIAPYHLNCSASEVVCVGADGLPTDPDPHNTAAHPGCMQMNATESGGFCSGLGVNMYMEGFVSYATGKYRTDGGSETPQCLVLWFSDWKLDSAGASCLCLCFLLVVFLSTALSSLRSPALSFFTSFFVPCSRSAFACTIVC